MNIILIGMRGSGKSTIGKLLSRKLDKTFYDLDTIIVKETGMTIPEIVETHGWDYFRDKESEQAEKIAQKENAVIATGGGVILREKNIAAFGKNGLFVFLKTSVEEIVKRIRNDKNRPSLTGEKSFTEEVEVILNERKSIYEQTADIIVTTDKKTPNEIAEEILNNIIM